MRAMHPRKSPKPRPGKRRMADILLLTLFAIAIFILGGLVVYLGPDLWVVVNGWMQQRAGNA